MIIQINKILKEKKMDLNLIRKLNYFNIHANIGFQFDGIDKYENYSIAYHTGTILLLI